MVKHVQRGLLRRGKFRKDHDRARKGASAKKAQRLESIGMMATKGVDETARTYEEQFEKNFNKPIKKKDDKYISSKNKAIMEFMQQKNNPNVNTPKVPRFNMDHGGEQQPQTKSKKSKTTSTTPSSSTKTNNANSEQATTPVETTPASTPSTTSTPTSNNGTVISRAQMNAFNTRGALVTAIKEGNTALIPDVLKNLPTDVTKSKLKRKVYFKMKKEKENLKKMKKALNRETALVKSQVKKHKMKNAKFDDIDEFLDEKEFKKNDRKKAEALMTLQKDELAEDVDYDSDDLMEEKRDEVQFGEVAEEPPRLSRLRNNLELKIEEKKREDKEREAERQKVIENYNRNKLLRQQQKDTKKEPISEKQAMLEKLRGLAVRRSMEASNFE